MSSVLKDNETASQPAMEYEKLTCRAVEGVEPLT